MQKDNTTVTDYTVMVRNLPSDVTFEQILSHFSNLYNLNIVDWQGRPPIEGCHPVKTVCLDYNFILYCLFYIFFLYY